MGNPATTRHGSAADESRTKAKLAVMSARRTIAGSPHQASSEQPLGKCAIHAEVRWRAWHLLILVGALTFVLCGLSLREFRRVSRGGDVPLRVTPAEAVRLASAGGDRWVVIADAECDCRHSVSLGGYRDCPAIAPGIPEGVTLLLPSPTYDEQCPPAHFEFAGVLSRVNAPVMPRYAAQGIVARTLWSINLRTTKSDLLIGCCVLLGLAALVALLGFAGFLKLQASERLRKGRVTAAERDALAARLARGPLKLRSTYVAARFLVPGLFVACGLFVGGWCLISATHEIREIRGEGMRWGHATPTPRFDEPKIRVKRRLWGSPLLADVAVVWGAPPAPHIPQREEYWVLWASHVPPPHEVRHDAQGTLSSAGLTLRNERYGAYGLEYLFGALLIAVSLYQSARLLRRRREFRRVLCAPQPLYLPFQRRVALRSYGVETGQVAYWFLARSGESVRQDLARQRLPIFDGSGKNVLVVTSRVDSDAEPILFADDGYPFQ